MIMERQEQEQILAKRRWAGVSRERRQQYMANGMHVDHPALTRVVLEIQRRMRRCINEDKGSGMLVLAPSGAGKTYLLSRLKARWPDEHEETLTKVRVISFSIPSNLNKKEMGKALLKAAGDPEWEKGVASIKDERIRALVSETETWLIAIDNAHDIPDKSGDKGIIAIGNWIRDLIDDTKRFVVLLGTYALEEVVDKNFQLRRRVAGRMNIPHFDVIKGLPRFMRFMHEIDKALPLAEMSGLGSENMTRRMAYASYGTTHFIFQILIEAVDKACRDGREKLLCSDLERAFDLVFQDAGKGINPFKEDGPARLLDRDGEPFHNFYDSSNPDPSNPKASRQSRRK